MTQQLCRLIGGEFDGDEGLLAPPLPDLIYAAWCPGRGSGTPCGQGGVHWYFQPLPRGTTLYRRGDVSMGVQRYVLGSITDDVGDALQTMQPKELVGA